jgi:hypothetical protein
MEVAGSINPHLGGEAPGHVEDPSRPPAEDANGGAECGTRQDKSVEAAIEGNELEDSIAPEVAEPVRRVIRERIPLIAWSAAT